MHPEVGLNQGITLNLIASEKEEVFMMLKKHFSSRFTFLKLRSIFLD